MPHYFAVLTVILLIGMVLTRALLMKRQGIKAMKFGNTDKKDFLIPPFASSISISFLRKRSHYPPSLTKNSSSRISFLGSGWPFAPVALDYYSGASFRSGGVFVSALIPTGPTGLRHPASSPSAAIRFMLRSPPCY
jgi:hypothetical protein